MSIDSRSPVKIGYKEFVLFPNDGNRHEVIDGRHYMNPSPTPRHQTISKRLQHELYTKVELAGLGEVFDAPLDVQLSDHDIVEPDLIVMLKSSAAKITPTRIIGPPELLIEILSPSTKKNDNTLKRALYQQSGVLEYWIVDGETQTACQLVLTDEGYIERQCTGSTLLAILPEIEIDLESVWR